MLTDEQIASEECRCLTAHAQFIGSGDVWIEGVNDFARAIESAACAPLLERIAELEAKLAQRVPDEITVSRDFIRGFRTLVHNYSLRAEAPDYYRGTEADAFSNAYARCGRDLAEVDRLLASAPAAPEQQEPDDVALLKALNEIKPIDRTKLFEMAVPLTKEEIAEADSDRAIPKAPNAQQAHPIDQSVAVELERSDWTPEEALRWYAAGRHYDTVPNGDGTSSARILDNGAVASNALKSMSREYAEHKGDVALEANAQQAEPMIRIAKTKLADLIAQGYRECGVMIEMTQSDGNVARGAVSNGGMVLWWHPEQAPPKAVPLTEVQAKAIAGEIFPMAQLEAAAVYHARLCEVYGIGTPGAGKTGDST